MENLTVVTRDNFDEYEDKGRNIFQGWCFGRPFCVVNRFSKEKYAQWDVSYRWTTDNTPIIGEIKVRNMDHNTYQTAYLQADKLKALRDLKGTSDAEIHYICIYNDKLLIWDLTNLDTSKLMRDEQQLPITTADGNKETKLKVIYHLNIKDVLKH